MYCSIALCAFVSYVAYAMSLPEEEPFSGITPKVTSSGAWALQDGVTEGGGESSGEASSVVAAMKADSRSVQNPVESAISSFELKWTSSYESFSQIANEQKNAAALTPSIALLDIIHADIVSSFSPFIDIASTSDGWGDIASDATVKSLDGGEYAFKKTLDEQQLTGKYDPESGSIFITRDSADGISYYAEIIPGDLAVYVQVFENSGPNEGLTRFLIADGEFRCSRLAKVSADGFDRYYKKTPESWQEFAGDANRVFVYQDGTITAGGNEYK